MTSARSGAGGAVVAATDASTSRMLVVGGEDSSFINRDSCELYDAAADRWSLQEARLPQAMRCHVASIAGGSAVLAVQWDGYGTTRCALFDVRSSSPSWQPMSSPACVRRYHAVAAVGEHSVVMLGGWDTDDQTTDTALHYDVRADSWRERPEWRLPAPSSGHCAAVIE